MPSPLSHWSRRASRSAVKRRTSARSNVVIAFSFLPRLTGSAYLGTDGMQGLTQTRNLGSDSRPIPVNFIRRASRPGSSDPSERLAPPITQRLDSRIDPLRGRVASFSFLDAAFR